jgi:ribosome-binding protein aMBF1 (putative translation factor)
MSSGKEREQGELAAFGQAVREVRERRGMSVSDLSNASKLPRARKIVCAAHRPHRGRRGGRSL